MALLQCPECGHKVSSEALSCPECSFPVEKIHKQFNSKKEIEKSPSRKMHENEKSVLKSSIENYQWGICISFFVIGWLYYKTDFGVGISGMSQNEILVGLGALFIFTLLNAGALLKIKANTVLIIAVTLLSPIFLISSR